MQGENAHESAVELNDSAAQYIVSGDLITAKIKLRKSLTLDPSLAEAHANLGIMLLATGDYANGWREFEWRWKIPKFSGDTPEALTRNFWRGELPKAPRRLFVHCEQGFGDTIHMIRYAIAAQQVGMEVTASVQPELVRLCKFLPIHRVISNADPNPDFDYHCPMMSMPLAMERLLGFSIPFAAGYIPCPPDLYGKWRDRLKEYDHPRVGIVWKGNPGFAMDRMRSVFLSEIMIAEGLPEGRYFSLQKGGAEEARAHGLIDFTDELTDFAETSALIANLDVVIAADTAVAHMAGAMGKPVQLILSAACDWRWGLSDEKTPWYNSVELHRRDRADA